MESLTLVSAGVVRHSKWSDRRPSAQTLSRGNSDSGSYRQQFGARSCNYGANNPKEFHPKNAFWRFAAGAKTDADGEGVVDLKHNPIRKVGNSVRHPIPEVEAVTPAIVSFDDSLFDQIIKMGDRAFHNYLLLSLPILC